MLQVPSNPIRPKESEPLFIKFANFKFTKESIEEFFGILEDETTLSVKELLIYIRTENDEYFDDTSPLTELEKEHISQELESDKLEFRKLLSALTFVRQKYDFVNENYEACVESLNSLCAVIPAQFTHHKHYMDKKHFGKLDFLLPSLENINTEEVGWADFILGFMALGLGIYLRTSPVTKIRLCPNCDKFFIHRKGKAEYCSEDCHDWYNRKKLSKEYVKEAVRKHRRLKKEKEGPIM